MANNHEAQRRNQQDNVAQRTDLNTPKRMRYSYGLLMDKAHFDLEQQYFNDKRWLLNRRIFGPGVVCGLDVQLSDDRKGFVVRSGLALDRCGREIIVPKRSESMPLPVAPPEPAAADKKQASWSQGPHCPHHDHCDDEFIHVVLCYHECASDPVPVMVGNCETEDPCVASAISERYTLRWRKGKAPERRRSEFPDIIEGQRINRDALVEYVTRPCRQLPDDCCIVLAEIRVGKHDYEYEPDDIDINVRPIVYTLPVLYQLIKSLVQADESDY